MTIAALSRGRLPTNSKQLPHPRSSTTMCRYPLVIATFERVTNKRVSAVANG
jgi:hypothetical protein